MRAALGELSEDDQELLKLVAWDGLTRAQVAVAIGCSEGAARTRLHRARNRLAAQIGADQAPERPLSRGEERAWSGWGRTTRSRRRRCAMTDDRLLFDDSLLAMLRDARPVADADLSATSLRALALFRADHRHAAGA